MDISELSTSCNFNKTKTKKEKIITNIWQSDDTIDKNIEETKHSDVLQLFQTPVCYFIKI